MATLAKGYLHLLHGKLPRFLTNSSSQMTNHKLATFHGGRRMRRMNLTLAALAMASIVLAQGGPLPGGGQGGGPGFPGGQFGGPQGPMMRMGPPMPMGILLWPDVQKELKISEKQ